MARLHVDGALDDDNNDDESCSDLVLMRNTVRGYCSAINELGHTRYPGVTFGKPTAKG